MIKNNKGFMLVEVIVTSTIIVTAMIGLYTSFNKIYKEHKVRNSYYNIDAIYATKEVINSMFYNNMYSLVNDLLETNTSKYLIENNSCHLTVSSCGEIANFYQVENMILVKYDQASIEGIDVVHESFKNYINYVINYYGISNLTTEYNYLLLTEIHQGDHYYYANLRVR